MTRLIIPALALFLTTGCTKYAYDVAAPPEPAFPVKEDQWAVLDRDPVKFRFTTVENRLVMQIHNPSTQPVQVVGERSILVDPQGESHPLKSQGIAPGSFVKYIFPPAPVTVERRGPTWGVGVTYGSGYGRYHGWSGYYGDWYYDSPAYFSVYDPNDATLWEWSRDDGEVRLTIAFAQDGKPFQQVFVITRRKL